MPSWVGPVSAIALVVIAFAFVAMAVVSWAVLKRFSEQSDTMAKELAELRRELKPTIDGLGRLAQSGEELADKVREEVIALVDTSRRLRRGVRRGARRVRDRLEELDALYEVVHDEVEDTALSVAATLRNVRHGAGAIGKLRRLLRRRR
ncbi:MAG: hypothetical protein AB7R55_08645 [Gemmatimonadales bacterium]